MKLDLGGDVERGDRALGVDEENDVCSLLPK